MDANRTDSQRRIPRYARRLTALSMLLTGLGLLAHEADVHTPLRADDDEAKKVAPPPVGHLVRVPLPITGNSDRSVKSQIRRLLNNREDGDNRPLIVVLEFGQDDQDSGAGSEFGRSYDLAQYLTSEEVSGVRLVAYIPHQLEGHALLVAMACQEIVMHADAQLGRAGSQGQQIDDVQQRAYEKIYDRRQTLPAAVALGTLDPNLEVYRANVKDGSRWILSDQLEDVRKEPGFSGYDTIVKKGDIGHFTAEELRTKYGFITRKVDDRADLAAALKLSRLTDDPSMGGEWRAIRVDLTGPLNARLVTQMQRGIEDRMQLAEQRGQPINFICLWIDSPGGSPTDSISMINYLDGLDRGQVHVVAYVPGTARADASTIAMACDDIVIEPDATLGGPGATVIEGDEKTDLVTRIQEVTKARSGQWSLWAAMIDRDLVVNKYSRKGTGQVGYFCEEEFDELRDADQWEKGDEIKEAGTLLKLTGNEAQEMGLVDHVVADYGEFQRIYSLEDEPEQVRRNWAHMLIDSLRESCCLPWLLIFIGSSALIAEMSSPGVGVPGFIALICFLLFFWLKVLDSTAGALEILLFVAGVGCIALEIFLLPGFGVFGLGGGAMVVVSLILASQTFVLPRNEYQLEQLPYSLGTVVAAGAGVFAGIILMRRYAHRTPGLNRIMLSPPTDEELQEMSQREAMTHFGHLRGKRGKAVTQLTPSGKAQFGDDLVDVITEGELLPKGADVVVVDVQGNLVVVEAVEEN